MKQSDECGDPFLRSRLLKEEATAIIWQLGLDSILRRYGTPHYTGSYFRGLMAWPDLDIELSLDPDPFSLEAFFDMGRTIAETFAVSSMTFHNRIRFKLFESSPSGLYWQICIEDDALTETWNVDLWSFEQSVLEENWSRMLKIAGLIDDSKRQMIIQLKHALLTDQGRTPKFSGYHLYQAVLYDGLTCEKEIMAYLRERGVDLA